MFELGNSSRPSSSPNLKTKFGVPELKNDAIIITKILPLAVYKSSIDEPICFTTHIYSIYKWQAIGRLRGRVETYVKIYLCLLLSCS